MTDTPMTFIAGDDANVGVQGVVHGDVNVYEVPPGASPEEKVELGVRLLAGGRPGKAWELLDGAVTAGHVTNRSAFYWLLALVSGRSQHELSPVQAAALHNEQATLVLVGEDVWTDGVRAIRRLLAATDETSEDDIQELLTEFGKLPDEQSSLILRHMEAFLEGPIEDQMWKRAMEHAADEQMAGNRESRVWKFFEPDPASPRLRPVREEYVPTGLRVQAAVGAAVLAVAGGYAGILLVQAGNLPGLLAYVVAVAGGCTAVRLGTEWRYRDLRRRAKDAEYLPRERRTKTPAGGFARQVDDRFDHYFAKYVPRGADRETWIGETAGFRKSIRDEMVEVYRESRTTAPQLFWLIRYRVGDIRRRWEQGTLWDYRFQLAVPPSMKTLTIVGTLLLLVGGAWAAGGAIVAAPLAGSCALVGVILGGWLAARAWMMITLERRRAVADRAEHDEVMDGCKAAFERWQEKLADRPSDQEMAAWLDCDRKVLLNEVLEHYALAMSGVVAYAFIETPGRSSKRARVKNGPWRYWTYSVLLFLLTADGVRQIAVDLDFETATLHDRRRTNYRYDTLAAVRVRHADDGKRTFELSLVNGRDIEARAVDAGVEELQEDEEPGTVTAATLDATGLLRTLHVLEGIAAEGKHWIARTYRRDP